MLAYYTAAQRQFKKTGLRGLSVVRAETNHRNAATDM